MIYGLIDGSQDPSHSRGSDMRFCGQRERERGEIIIIIIHTDE